MIMASGAAPGDQDRSRCRTEAEGQAMPFTIGLRRLLSRTAAAALMLLTLGGITPGEAATVAAPPIPAGAARIWFYRIWDPSITLNVANVALNGTPAGSVLPYGPGLYRDVQPGHYRISVQSFDGDPGGQFKDVDLTAGEEVFVKIIAEADTRSDGDVSAYKEDNFYVWLVSPELARREIAAHPL
jgi:hypothetical protein